MPYYCTVPRCTSMAGKAKNVSFHQFPRDEELAKLWNNILKRGKPYTKYSKVCSLHFRPEDYTITSVGKNKGQWRTLRKDAIPSRNLPSESPTPTTHHRRSTGAWLPSHITPSIVDPQTQQQMAQAIYIQTMLAMQAASTGSPPLPNQNDPTKSTGHSSGLSLSEIELLINQQKPRKAIDRLTDDSNQALNPELHTTSYKCNECSKCFKDPDVFILHKRSHTNETAGQEKENLNANNDVTRQETLRANPILANLLKAGSNPSGDVPNGIFDTNSILSIENQIMAALAANMESYIRNLSTILSNQAKESSDSDRNDENSELSDQNVPDNQNLEHENQNSVQNTMNDDENALEINQNPIKHDNNLVIDQNNVDDDKNSENSQNSSDYSDIMKIGDVVDIRHSGDGHTSVDDQNCVDGHDTGDGQNTVNDHKTTESQGSMDKEPSCDKEDLDESKDSIKLVIDA